MRGTIKKLGVMAIAAILIASLAACGKTQQSEAAGNKKVTGDKEVKDKKSYSSELAKYFPDVEGTVLNFIGTLEYGHGLTLNKVKEKNDKLILVFKGQIEDVSEGEGPSKEELMLETEYEIGNDYVKEIQKNEKRRHSQSIIREQIVLKLPLEKGKTWEQKVNVEGKEYTAQTKIVELSKDEDGKNLIKTETLIKDIEFYPDNTYRETKTFKEGKGLVEFQNVILFPAAYEGDKEAHMEFGYHLFEK